MAHFPDVRGFEADDVVDAGSNSGYGDEREAGEADGRGVGTVGDKEPLGCVVCRGDGTKVASLLKAKYSNLRVNGKPIHSLLGLLTSLSLIGYEKVTK